MAGMDDLDVRGQRSRSRILRLDLVVPFVHETANVGPHHLEVVVELAGVEDNDGGQYEAHDGAGYCADRHRLGTVVRLALQVGVD